VRRGRLGGRGAALLLFVAAGCSGLPPPMVGTPGPVLPDAEANAAYEALLEHYSAKRQVFIGFDTILFGGITYESLPFREARIRRRDTFQAQSPGQLALDLKKAEAEGADFYEFTLGVYIQNPRFDDLDLANSIWHVALQTPVGEVSPALVKRVGKANVNTRAYYPYMGDFWTEYRVRFPKALDGRPLVTPGLQTFTVVLASSLGRAEFPLPTQ
jgi:hypothetical protein